MYRRRPLRVREPGRPRSFLWHVSAVLAQLCGMLVVSCSVLLLLPHLDMRALRRVGAMLPDPNPEVVRTAEFRVNNGFDTLAPPLGSSRPTFGMGSSKETVVAAQGRPTIAGGGIWRYGASEVYFLGDRVAGWRESPSDPLMLR
jgi:hypothetical protein